MLTSEQAKKNQEKYGFNELTEGKKKGFIKKGFFLKIKKPAGIANRSKSG